MEAQAHFSCCEVCGTIYLLIKGNTPPPECILPETVL